MEVAVAQVPGMGEHRAPSSQAFRPDRPPTVGEAIPLDEPPGGPACPPELVGSEAW